MHGGVDKRPVQRGTYHGRSGGQAVGEREGEGFVYQDVGVQELGGVPRIAQADKGIVGVVDDGEVFGITQGEGVGLCATGLRGSGRSAASSATGGEKQHTYSERYVNKKGSHQKKITLCGKRPPQSNDSRNVPSLLNR